MLQKSALIEFLKREQAKAPVFISTAHLSKSKPSPKPRPLPVNPSISASETRDQLILIYPASRDAAESEGHRSYIESIAAAVKIPKDRFQIYEASSSWDVSRAQLVVGFGISQPAQNSAPFLETLNPSDLKTNAVEKRKLWDALKNWMAP